MSTNNNQKSERKFNGILILAVASGLMFTATFILPFFVKQDYSIAGDTISELGAQHSPSAWIVNSLLFILAIASVVAGWRSFSGFLFHRTILVLFGISLMLMALFNHAPVSTEICYINREAGWHTYFASTSVLTFIILAFATALIQDKQSDRFLSVLTGLSAILISILMSEAKVLDGAWQKLFFIISSGWMIYSFRQQ